jgi:hypothetical protein
MVGVDQDSKVTCWRFFGAKYAPHPIHHPLPWTSPTMTATIDPSLLANRIPPPGGTVPRVLVLIFTVSRFSHALEATKTRRTQTPTQKTSQQTPLQEHISPHQTSQSQTEAISCHAHQESPTSECWPTPTKVPFWEYVRHPKTCLIQSQSVEGNPQNAIE